MSEDTSENKRVCACGCGIVIAAFDKWHHRPRSYVRGHTNKGKKFRKLERYEMLCSKCNSKTSISKLGHPVWHHSKNNNLICRKCYDKEHYWSDPEYQLARAQSYRERNREKILARDREYKKTHKDELNQKRREYYYKNREDQIRKRILNARKSGALFKILRYQLIDILGPKCVICGYNTDRRALCLDHINGGGRADRAFHISPHRFYRFYYDNIDIARQTLQVLCANCNQIKLSENRENLTSKIIGSVTNS